MLRGGVALEIGVEQGPTGGAAQPVPLVLVVAVEARFFSLCLDHRVPTITGHSVTSSACVFVRSSALGVCPQQPPEALVLWSLWLSGEVIRCSFLWCR